MRNSKIAIVVFLAVMSEFGPSRAQSLSGGIRAGASFAGFWGKDADSQGDIGVPEISPVVGPQLGGFLCYGIRGFLDIQADAVFVMKGEHYAAVKDVTEDASRLGYVDIPIRIVAKAPVSWRVLPFVAGGPNIGVLVYAQDWSMRNGEVSALNIRETTRPLELGVALGAGAAVTVGQGGLIIEARYTPSLTSMYAGTEYHDEDRKNWTASLLLGYEFRRADAQNRSVPSDSSKSLSSRVFFSQ